MITKPLHSSQRLIETYEAGCVKIHLFLIENYELERLLLGFGDGLEVLQLPRLRNRMKAILQKSMEKYEND